MAYNNRPKTKLETIRDAVVDIDQRGGGGGGSGSGLPAVTDADNGDVLTVVEGSWAKAAPSGGGALIIDYNGDTFPSYNDIVDAVKNGKIVVVMDADDDYVVLYYFNSATYDSETYMIHFYNKDEEGFNGFTLQSSTKTDPMTT